MVLHSIRLCVVICVALGGWAAARAAEPIKVLLGHGLGVTEETAIVALDQLNEVVSNTGITDHVFESAAVDEEEDPTVFSANCIGTESTPANTLIACAESELSSEREANFADIVILVVNDMDMCGKVPDDAVNVSVSIANDGAAYAVLKESCIEEPTRGMVVAAHEVGHLLGLEHHDGDASPTVPVGDNHAAEDSLLGFGNLTAEGSAGDCLFCDFHAFYSEDGKLFPNDEAAGDAEFSNSKRVIEELSWDVVALYRGKIFANGILKCSGIFPTVGAFSV